MAPSAWDVRQTAHLLWEEVLPAHPRALEILECTLRQVWNARGEADVATIHLVLPALLGRRKAADYLAHLDRDLRKLDR